MDLATALDTLEIGDLSPSQITPKSENRTIHDHPSFNDQRLATIDGLSHLLSADSRNTEISTQSPDFHLFPLLPAELRLKIWTFCLPQPRVLELSVVWKSQTADSAFFWTQRYLCDLSLTAHCLPSLLGVSLEARKHILLRYNYHLFTTTKISTGPTSFKTITHPGFWISLKDDTLIMRDYWNVVAMGDFFQKVGGGLRRIALDVGRTQRNDFLKDLVSNDLVVKYNVWPLKAVKEIVLFDGTGVGPFRRSYNGPKVDFRLEDATGIVGENFLDAKKQLNNMFNFLDANVKPEGSTTHFLNKDGRVVNTKDWDWVTGRWRPKITFGELAFSTPSELMGYSRTL